VLAVFNRKNLSADRIKDILAPRTPLGTISNATGDSTKLYYGIGFEVLYTPGDTIILHGGSNEGYKAFMAYSIVHRNGFVLMTNSDLGRWMPAQVCKITVGLDIDDFFRIRNMDQYPSNAMNLFKIYKKSDTQNMLAALGGLKQQKNGDIGSTTLTELGEIFFDLDSMVAKKLLEENVISNPGSPYAYYILGKLNMKMNEYEQARRNFMKARELNYLQNPIDPEIKKCEQEINRRNHLTSIYDRFRNQWQYSADK
jgi:hypothetical protein